MIPDLATLRDLLARTQAATGSDHRLNLELAAALLGGEVRPLFNLAAGCVVDAVVCPSPLGSNETIWRQEARDWTGSLDAAVRLVERVLPNCTYSASKLERGNVFTLHEPPENPDGGVTHPGSWARQHHGGGATTMPLAIIEAMLTALSSQAERQGRAAALSDLAAGDAELMP